MKRPNIILLITHDTGRDLSPYGISTVDTPNCERLQREAALFKNSFCTAPQCSPSRAAIVTGRYPHANGVLGLTHADFGWDLHPSERTIAALLKKCGYQTWLLGHMHETPDANRLGFDHVDLGFSLLELPKHLKPLLDSFDGQRPFFCQIGCFETHRPFDQDHTTADDHLGIHIPDYLVDGPETRAELRQMQGMIKRFDKGLGGLLDTMDDHGLRDNTLLIVTTDHGLALPRAKGTLFDAGIETMLFVRYPERIPGGVRYSELVSNVDILPTVLDAAGSDLPGNLQGRSFLPLLENRTYSARHEIFAEKTFHGCYDPMRCIRNETHKYIRYFEKSTIHRIPGDIIGGGANRELGPMQRVGAEALYDLVHDPLEYTNLVSNPNYITIGDELKARLYQWMVETDDPLLDGPIASPFYHRTIQDLKP